VKLLGWSILPSSFLSGCFLSCSWCSSKIVSWDQPIFVPLVFLSANWLHDWVILLSNATETQDTDSFVYFFSLCFGQILLHTNLSTPSGADEVRWE
jgi:hypothetical protein